MGNLKFIFLLSLSFHFIMGNHSVAPSNPPGKSAVNFYSQPPDSFFISLENHWLRALEQNDTIYLNKILSPDFVDISYKGEIRTKKNVLAKRVYNNDMGEQLSEMKVRKYKNTAIVTGINNVSIKNINRKILVRFTDVFIKKEKEWYVVSAQETMITE